MRVVREFLLLDKKDQIIFWLLCTLVINFIIAIAFGKSNDKSREVNSFKRKKLSKISDNADDKLEPARLAPSAINSQPWYFKHTEDGFDVYQIRQNIRK